MTYTTYVYGSNWGYGKYPELTHAQVDEAAKMFNEILKKEKPAFSLNWRPSESQVLQDYDMIDDTGSMNIEDYVIRVRKMCIERVWKKHCE